MVIKFIFILDLITPTRSNFTDTGTVEATIVVQDSKLQEVKKNIKLHIQDAPFYEKYALIF